MSAFTIAKHKDDTFHIECLFVVYRGLFGHHPDWLVNGANGYSHDEVLGQKEGFSTKFWFLVEDELKAEDVVKRLNYYQEQYDKLILEIENDDKRWGEFPFKGNLIVYRK